MSIRLLRSIFLAGVLSPVDGSTLSLSAALEADLVNQGKAVWVAAPELTASEMAHASAHARMRAPNGVPIILAQSAIPMILPPGNGSTTGVQWSGTDGTFTTNVAFPAYTFPQSAFMYFPANQIAGTSNLAGWYYTILSGTGGGKVYNSLYVSGSPHDAIPATPTAFAGVTNGAWLTQTTSAISVGPIATLPGRLLGANGRLLHTLLSSFTNNANNKVQQVRLGGLSFGASTWTTNTFGRMMYEAYNRNSDASQLCANYTGYGNGAIMIRAVDTSINQELDVTLAVSANTDYLIIEGYGVEVLPT